MIGVEYQLFCKVIAAKLPKKFVKPNFKSKYSYQIKIFTLLSLWYCTNTHQKDFEE